MIHLKKYNESGENIPPLNSNYIKDCFVEFIDIPSTKINVNFRNFLYIELKEPIINRAYNIDGTFVIEEYIESLQKHTEFYLDVENCIDKVHLKYPNYKCDAHLSNNGGHARLNLKIKDNRL